MLSTVNTFLFYALLAVIFIVFGWLAFRPEDKSDKS
jgi:hypothetical protein